MSAATLNELARRWWWTRIEPDWRPRTAAESQAILDEVGLTGDFLAPRLSGSLWTATPTATRATPASSTRDGTWASTTMPIAVAVAGSSETSSA